MSNYLHYFHQPFPRVPGIQENEYYITDVPSQIEGCGLNEFKEILQFISINHNVKLKDCRPKKILNYVKVKLDYLIFILEDQFLLVIPIF